MGSPAEIDERPIGVHRDRFVFPQLADSLKLERIVGKAAPRFRPVHHLAHEWKVPGRDLGHLQFEPLEIVGRERPVYLKVVVEPVLNGGTKTDSSMGEKLSHCRGQDVRR
jgi:hypothetical protein